MNNSIYAVILAGGKGERLWPLSREKRPKQLLAWKNKRSLLEYTVDRLHDIAPDQQLYIMTTKQQQDVITQHINTQTLAEPYACNTAPAILLACLHIAQQDPDATIIFSPADHAIGNQEIYIQALQTAITHSQAHHIITLLGVTPQYPATGYGYIEYVDDIGLAKSVVRFHEKPNNDVATLYCQLPNMAWNIGIFCAPVAVFLHAYQQYAPTMYHHVIHYFQTGDPSFYERVERISFDYAIMEKIDRAAVVPVVMQWSDVGNLETFLSAQSSSSDNVITIDASDNIVATDRLTVLIGVQDLCVVQVDDVLMIVRRHEVEKVKRAVQEIQQRKLNQYL